MRTLLSLTVAALAVSSSALAQTGTTTRHSVSTNGAQGQGDSGGQASITPDGRYVAFASIAINLVNGDTNGVGDIFLRDRNLGTTERISLRGANQQSDADSYSPAISDDGRYVAFMSYATNLVLGDTNGWIDVFVRDRQTNSTTRVSLGASGAQADADCYWPTLSADGNFIAFASAATNLVPGDTNGQDDIFVKNRVTGAIERISVDVLGNESDGPAYQPVLSANGRYVAFWSYATNLVAGDTNAMWDVFLRDRQAGTIERVNLDSSGNEANGDTFWCSLSADGRFVAFDSTASNLVSGDTNGFNDIFVKDRLNGLTRRVNVDSNGLEADADCYYPALSADGLHVAFNGAADNLVPNDTNGVGDVFVHDLLTGETEIASLDSSGLQGDSDSDLAALSGDGRLVAFESVATNLVSGDTNSFSDIFVRERLSLQFASLCDPGQSGVLACPCSNPAAGASRGCDNSAATGGAHLGASGTTSVSNDTLVFSTSGEKPTATSIVLQGTALSAGGLVFGQGVRCTAGTMKRLYIKTASGGAISAPGAGDASVTARSAALGDTILPGQSRWYLVYYRDPIVLGGCSATSTFNATQTGRVDWAQ